MRFAGGHICEICFHHLASHAQEIPGSTRMLPCHIPGCNCADYRVGVPKLENLIPRMTVAEVEQKMEQSLGVACTSCGDAIEAHSQQPNARGLYPCTYEGCNCQDYNNGMPIAHEPLNTPKSILKQLSDQLPHQTFIPVRYDLVLPDWHREVAEVLHEGAEKYGDYDWQNIPLDSHLNHLVAHVNMFREGNKDERHLINISCRAMFAYYKDKHP